MAAPRILVYESDTEVAEKLCTFIIERANKAIKESGKFYIGLSGGSLIKYLSKGLPAQEMEWQKWRIFFCDERHVPFTDPECTYTAYKTDLFDKVGLKEDNIFINNPDLSVEEAAEKYHSKMTAEFHVEGIPSFHMLLLGMGPDGHTCSLFPGHPLLKEEKRLIAAISDSPKPPPCRITMTYPLINNCACAVFAACGAGKADIVQRVLEGKEDVSLPAACVRPTNGELVWFLDKPAAQNLKNKL